MLKVFNLPDLGEGLTESEILTWKVAEGDQVTVNQVLADVETAKAVVELSSPFEGAIARLHAEPGTVVEVGAPIISFELPGSDGPDQEGGSARAETAKQDQSSTAGPDDGTQALPDGRVPTLVGYGAAADTGKRPTRRAKADGAGTQAPPQPQGTAPAAAAPSVSTSAPAPSNTPRPHQSAGERPRSTPPVRKLAKDLGVDMTTLTGTGRDGLITRDDVQRAAGAGPSDGASAAPRDAGTGTSPSPGEGPSSGTGRTLCGREREVRTKVQGVRKHTAAAMVSSAFTAPHVTEFLTVDVTETMELLERIRRHRVFRDVRVTVLTLAAKAVCLAMERTPEINARWDEQAQEIVGQHFVNLGIAAATPRGLMVPNVKDAQAMDLRELAGALAELTETARAGRTAPVAMSGGTFTITNVGVFGVDAGTPILNPGEAGILALGQVRRQPWEHQGEIALRQMMTLSLSFDHRLVDGEQGSRFLADVGQLLSDPAMAMLR